MSADATSARRKDMQKISLNDGNSIPQVGFGVYLIPSDGSTYRAVREALLANFDVHMND